MAPAELLGKHVHRTSAGNVGIFARQGKYLARGRWNGKAFGPTVGASETEAEQSLARLLVELADGTFVPPSESRSRRFRGCRPSNISLRHLVNDYIAEKRKTRGRKTSADYASRLSPVLDFFEQKSSLKRWPIAERINRDAIIELKTYLMARQVTRNGHVNGKCRAMSPRHIRNCLEQLRQALAWAGRTDVRKLPVEFGNPVSADLIDPVPSKDPLRRPPFPMTERLEMVERMDEWQVLHLWMPLVLPPRPEGVTGIVISDIELEHGIVWLGSRFGGNDFSKGGTTVKMPLPQCLLPLVQTCFAGRSEGPWFRSRVSFRAGTVGKAAVNSRDELENRFHDALAQASRDAVQTIQDRKRVFRALLQQLGGMSKDQLASELKSILPTGTPHRPYELRASVTQEMKLAGVSELEWRYFTEHKVGDIMNVYSGLDPVREMEKCFTFVEPLLAAIVNRAQLLGVI